MFSLRADVKAVNEILAMRQSIHAIEEGQIEEAVPLNVHTLGLDAAKMHKRNM